MGGGKGGWATGSRCQVSTGIKTAIEIQNRARCQKGYCIDNTQAQSHCMYIQKGVGNGWVFIHQNNLFRRELSDWGKKATGQISREKIGGGGGGRKEKREKIC